jgi:hypothetical protein
VNLYEFGHFWYSKLVNLYEFGHCWYSKLVNLYETKQASGGGYKFPHILWSETLGSSPLLYYFK